MKYLEVLRVRLWMTLISILILDNREITFRVPGREIFSNQIATWGPIRWWFTILSGKGLLIDDKEVMDPFDTSSHFPVNKESPAFGGVPIGFNFKHIIESVWSFVQNVSRKKATGQTNLTKYNNVCENDKIWFKANPTSPAAKVWGPP